MKYSIFITFALIPWFAQAQVQSSDIVVVNPQAAQEELVIETRPAPKKEILAASSQSSVVESLPATYVQAAPVNESAAERIRKQREAAELNTEMMIVEQLEQDRIQAERERAKRLFGLEQKQSQQAPVRQEPIETDPGLKQEIQEIRSLLEEKQVETEEPEVESHYAYKPKKNDNDYDYVEQLGISGHFGAASYPGVDNIKSLYAAGIALSAYYDYGLILELAYTNSSFEIFTPQYANNRVDLDQHTISGNAKYRLFDGRFSPTIGGMLAYHRRSYDFAYIPFGCYGGFCNPTTSTEATSDAIDLGFILGFDMNVSKRFNIGVDLKYTFNLTNAVNDQYRSFYNNGRYFAGSTPIEELDGLILGFNAAFKF